MLCAYKTLLSNRRVVLASASERRKEILGGLGFPFDVVQSPFDEDKNRPNTNDPKEFTQWTASQKALAIIEDMKTQSNPPDFVIGADTVVFLEDKILGKPTDTENAVEMLKILSGNVHSVVTGLSIHYKMEGGYKERLTSEVTQVKMAALNDLIICSYVATGEPLGKAGSYGIQGLGGSLIEAINGDYYNVVGFPLHRFTAEMVSILQELKEANN
ncbi:dTTP/UTP pyrophosphatase-like [Daphnia pulex]|uniref:dTTP/UTP pyrophosphatase-like n=1 Tax=Daphnia pulex TaxID=6669 RepID=UPI001EE07EAF|nr:dTTP/UTP pyrophosphatase-like [Daphnia pulex]